MGKVKEMVMSEEEIEKAAIAAANNFGAPEFDRVVDDGDRVLLYDGMRLAMIINVPLVTLMRELVDKFSEKERIKNE